jgi:hypothetical protein
MRRLMLKDLAILKRQKILFFMIGIVFLPIFNSSQIMAMAWCVFPVIVLVQTLQTLDLNGQEERLLRFLPLDSSTVIGSRYLLAPATLAAILVVVCSARFALKSVGAPILLMDPGIAAYSFAIAFAYFAFSYPVSLVLGPIKARWVNAFFIVLMVAGGTVLNSLTSPVGQRMPGLAPYSFDLTGLTNSLSRPIVFLSALLVSILLYVLSFLASARIWKAKAA